MYCYYGLFYSFHFIIILERPSATCTPRVDLNSTSDNAHNGHVDEHDTKEEEVYQDLCSIQRASRPQVLFILFLFLYIRARL